MAAFFNPNPVTYTPSQATIAGAGALGNSMYDIWLKNYQQKQQDRQLQNAENTLAFNQENEGIKNQHNEQKQLWQQYKDQATIDNDINKYNLDVKKDNDAYIQNVNKGSMYAGTQGIDTTGWTDSQLYGLSGLYQSPNYSHATMGNQDVIYDKSTGGYVKIANKPRGDGSSGVDPIAYREWRLYNQSRANAGLSEIPYHEFQDTKDSLKNMGMGLKDASLADRATEKLATAWGITTAQLQDLDTRDLTANQLREYGVLVETRKQALRNGIPNEAIRRVNDLSKVVFSAEQMSEYLKSDNTGMLDFAINGLNSYLGLGDADKRIRKALGEGAYAMYRNYMLKALSGGAVTDGEANRFNQAMGVLYKEDKTALNQIRQHMGSVLAELNSIRNSYDRFEYNYKFGDLNRSLYEAINRLSNVAGTNIKKTNTDNLLTGDDIRRSSNSTQPQQQNSSPTTPTKYEVSRREYEGKIIIQYSDGTFGEEK